MGQLRKHLKTTKPQTDFEIALEKELLSAWAELAVIINKGLYFSSNLNCAIIAVADTGAANTEFAVAHGLKRIPSGYLITRRDRAGIVYDSGTSFTVDNIYLKCSSANAAVTLMIF